MQLDRVKSVIQVKRCKTPVGVRTVQKAFAAQAKYRCAEAVGITNSPYTR